MRRWCPSQLTKCSGPVIGARPCLRVRRREQDRPGAIRRGMPEERSRETGRKRNKSARTAREQVGSGQSRMRRVTKAGSSLPRRSDVAVQARTSSTRASIAHTPSMASTRVRPADHRNRWSRYGAPGADADDPWSACPAQQRHQPGGESEVTEMVCSKLHLKAIRRCLPAGQRHDFAFDQEIKGCGGASAARVDDRCKAGRIRRL